MRVSLLNGRDAQTPPCEVYYSCGRRKSAKSDKAADSVDGSGSGFGSTRAPARVWKSLSSRLARGNHLQGFNRGKSEVSPVHME